MNVAPRITSYCCPACGGLIGEAAPIEAVKDAVTSLARRAILEALARKPGKAVMRDVLMEKLYGDRSDGGPITADKVIKVHVSQLRRQIEPFGWTITHGRGGSGHLAQWKLIPTGDAR